MSTLEPYEDVHSFEKWCDMPTTVSVTLKLGPGPTIIGTILQLGWNKDMWKVNKEVIFLADKL